ncbi:hypothetical protein Golax_019292 [Gossypium laxum]|uniref:Uncharacterized protein n=1 Tax=Gossypium laxum TaxID=34288 RepID=A0A7J8Z779_9ROSI|nr:hypothetical protein [Gossypium laxum]
MWKTFGMFFKTRYLHLGGLGK